MFTYPVSRGQPGQPARQIQPPQRGHLPNGRAVSHQPGFGHSVHIPVNTPSKSSGSSVPPPTISGHQIPGTRK